MECFRTFNGNGIFTSSRMTNKNETIHGMKKTGLNGQQFLLRHKIYGSAEPPVYQIFNERNRNPSETSEWDPRWLEITFPHQFRHGKQQLSSSQPARSIRQTSRTSTSTSTSPSPEGADFPPYGLDTNLIAMYSGC